MSTYVYGITQAGTARRVPEGLAGVGDPPRPVRVLRSGGLTALVSDAPPGLRPRRRDLFAHQRVLTVATAGGPVLPLRFGAVSPDDATVRSVLADHADLYRGQLSTVADRVEFNVKALHREDEVVRRVLDTNPEIRRLNETTRRRGNGAHHERIQLGRLVAEAVREQEEHDARTAADALAPHAESHRPGPDGTGLVLNLSFLVGRDDAPAFLTAVEELRAASPQLELRVSGPLPPYSFVVTEPARTA
jgi:hypothetical protein